MSPELFLRLAIRPALELLPSPMRGTRAEAMILAICLQESKLSARRQISRLTNRPTGPARGFPQFETIGVAGVLQHRASQSHALRLCHVLRVPPDVLTVHAAIEHNDVLAAGFARLNLWTHRDPLPPATEPAAGWRIYLEVWRPGAPHPETWPEHWSRAWATTGGDGA